MALQRRMPQTDVLGSCQNPCMGSLNPEKGPKTEVNPGRSEVKALQTTPSYRAQADSATSFYIFIGHMREAQKRVYILSDEKKKEIHRNGDPGTPAWKGTTAGAQAGQLTCGRRISSQSFQRWHCPRGAASRPVDH